MTVSWLSIDLIKTETHPSKRSWTSSVIDGGPIVMWRAAEGGERTYAPLDRSTFEFTVPISKNIPQTMQIDKYGGIGYNLVAKMAVNTRRGILWQEYVPLEVEASIPVTMPKYELLSTWPWLNTPDTSCSSGGHFTLHVASNWLPCAIGETMNFHATIKNQSEGPMEVEGINILLLQKITLSDGLSEGAENTSTQRIIASKVCTVRKTLAAAETAECDVDFVVPKGRTLEDVTLAEHIKIEHFAAFGLPNSNVSDYVFDEDETVVYITPFSRAMSTSLMGRIGSCEPPPEHKLPWRARPFRRVKREFNPWLDSFALKAMKASGSYAAGNTISIRALVYVTENVAGSVADARVLLQKVTGGTQQQRKETTLAAESYHIREPLVYCDAKIYKLDITVPEDARTDGEEHGDVRYRVVVEIDMNEGTLVDGVYL